uniref:Uncharacterized protein n=1 Tax=Rhizophagus irregularis (strain DAOM 181602 / DAOM 197198 / MUCL 43194) TaxID=747089 RepID=U9UDX3_RHIID
MFVSEHNLKVVSFWGKLMDKLKIYVKVVSFWGQKPKLKMVKLKIIDDSEKILKFFNKLAFGESLWTKTETQNLLKTLFILPRHETETGRHVTCIINMFFVHKKGEAKDYR